MKIEHERGYLVIAQDTDQTDYVTCARVLSRSIKKTQPSAKICLLTDKEILVDRDFDYVKIFPYGDQSGENLWKLHNDWQCFYASPFRQTLKIEADMIVPQDISHWFDVCQHRDVVVTVGARDYHNRKSVARHYRKIFDNNDLPDVYNAITYWRFSRDAERFFNMIKKIFERWSEVMTTIKYGQDQPLNTDLAYAIAVKILGEEKFTLPGDIPGLIHMKKHINNLEGDDWTGELVWELTDREFRINTVSQLWPVHYHVKKLAQELIKSYG